MPLDHATLLQLKRWNTPTIFNGWEQITGADIGRDGFNCEPVTDFMPEMGPMVGRVGPARAMAVPEAVAGAAVRHREHTARASRSLDSEIQRSLHSR